MFSKNPFPCSNPFSFTYRFMGHLSGLTPHKTKPSLFQDRCFAFPFTSNFRSPFSYVQNPLYNFALLPLLLAVPPFLYICHIRHYLPYMSLVDKYVIFCHLCQLLIYRKIAWTDVAGASTTHITIIIEISDYFWISSTRIDLNSLLISCRKNHKNATGSKPV